MTDLTDLNCGSCGAPLGDEDLFCGECGTQAPGGQAPGPQGEPGRTWPATGTWPKPPGGDSGQAPAEPVTPGPFFGHAAARPPGRPTNPTRYLCAAAYLDPDFAHWVTGELLVSHRAIAPSVDTDVEPVIRHCLHARRIALIRDLVLTTVLVLGLLLAPAPAIAVLVIALAMGFVRGPAWQRRSLGAKFAIGAGVATLLIGVVVVVVIVTLISNFSQGFPTGAVGAPGGNTSGAGLTVLKTIVFLILVAAPVAVHTHVKFRTLSERLRPGAGPMKFSPASPGTEARIAQVEAAQWGNLTLYSGENPFIGTGRVTRAWSIAVELDRARPAGQAVARPKSRRHVDIDPAELHQAIRERLLKLDDPELPSNERISALTVEDHLVGEGLCGLDSPLIDKAQKIPYSQAGQEAIAALIRHPQAGLRYYQRVSVSDRGQPVLSNGRVIIGSTDQEVAVSAFVHVAVEGRMFYLEFVATAMPPILSRYHLIDAMPKISSGPFMAKVAQEAASTMLADVLKSPVRAFRSLGQIMREQSAEARGGAVDDDYLFSDVGARESARELGAAGRPRTYIQTLDVTKYTKIVERLLTDAVLDFLAAKGADTTAYAASASTVINAGTYVNVGTNQGGFAVGTGATVNLGTQGQQGPPGPPPATPAG